jgi:DNA-binding SARP family transcriptional activator
MDARVTPRLSIRLLGRFEAALDGRPIRLNGRHGRALLALLALQPRIRLRDAVAADLWPDAGGASSSTLRQALWTLRTALSSGGADPDAVVVATSDTIGLAERVSLEVDVTQFERLAVVDSDHEEALAWYRGDLAEDLGHECFAAERERLSDLYEDTLLAAAEARLMSGDVAGARLSAAALVARDPLREDAHSILIAAYGMGGSRSQVVRQYRRLCAVLRRELGEAPLPDTDAIYRIALDQTLERSRRRAAALTFSQGRPAPALVPAG